MYVFMYKRTLGFWGDSHNLKGGIAKIPTSSQGHRKVMGGALY